MTSRLGEPARAGAAPAGAGFLLALLLPTAFSLYANFQGIQLILAPAEVEALDPLNKLHWLAVMTTICALTGVLGLTMGGAVSDATRSRFGRRAPWLAGMALASAALSLAMSGQSGLSGVALFFGALWFTMNFFQAAMLAVAPDRIPERQRSHASSIIGLAGPLGVLIGVNLAAFAPGVWGHGALAGLLVLSTAAFLIGAREAPCVSAVPPRRMAQPGRRLIPALNLFASFRSRDYTLAYAFRVLMFIAQFSVNNYLLYVLQDHIRVADARVAAGEISSLRTLATIAAIAVGWRIATRTDKRKIFAQVYAIGMAAAMLAPVFSPTWAGMLVFAILGGLAMGAYSTVDLTLMSLVLPSRDSAGRDLALLVMAGASAQFVAPWLGDGLIRYFGWDALFIGGAFVTVLAGLAASSLRRAP